MYIKFLKIGLLFVIYALLVNLIVCSNYRFTRNSITTINNEYSNYIQYSGKQMINLIILLKHFISFRKMNIKFEYV